MTRRTLLGVLLPAAAMAQANRLSKGPQWMEIVLERNEDGNWRPIDPGLVLNPGDLVRFRFRTNFDGYSYVINYGTSGTRTLLFPGQETGRKNRVVSGTEYSVPSTGASFKVAGPAGHDIVYWLMSPVPLTGDPAAAVSRQENLPPAPKLIPRCDQSIFRARGLCIDSSAGARNVTGDEPLPDAISSIPRMTKRELVIMQNQEVARVSSPSVLTGPVVYQFRLAHR